MECSARRCNIFPVWIHLSPPAQNVSVQEVFLRTSSPDTDCILTFSLGLFVPTLRRFCRLRSTIWYDMMMRIRMSGDWESMGQPPYPALPWKNGVWFFLKIVLLFIVHYSYFCSMFMSLFTTGWSQKTSLTELPPSRSWILVHVWCCSRWSTDSCLLKSTAASAPAKKPTYTMHVELMVPSVL